MKVLLASLVFIIAAVSDISTNPHVQRTWLPTMDKDDVVAVAKRDADMPASAPGDVEDKYKFGFGGMGMMGMGGMYGGMPYGSPYMPFGGGFGYGGGFDYGYHGGFGYGMSPWGFYGRR